MCRPPASCLISRPSAGLRIEARVLKSLRPDSAPDELTAAGLLKKDGTEYGSGTRWWPRWPTATCRRRGAASCTPSWPGLCRRVGGVAAERVSGHLNLAGQPQAALEVLERAVSQTQRAGDLGRSATLCLAAMRLAHGSEALRTSRGALEEDAIRRLFSTRRWTELDPLIRCGLVAAGSAARRRRARLAIAFAWHLFSRGSLAESWGVIQEELGYLERTGALRHAGRLLSTGGYVMWLRGDAELARRMAERGPGDSAPRRESAHVVVGHPTTASTSATGSAVTAARRSARSARTPQRRGRSASPTARRSPGGTWPVTPRRASTSRRACWPRAGPARSRPPGISRCCGPPCCSWKGNRTRPRHCWSGSAIRSGSASRSLRPG